MDLDDMLPHRHDKLDDDDLEDLVNNLSHLLVGDQPPNWALVLGAHLVHIIEQNQEITMSALQDVETALGAAIDTLTTSVQAKDAEIATLHTAAAADATKITDLEAQVAAEATTVATLQADVDRLTALDTPVPTPPAPVATAATDPNAPPASPPVDTTVIPADGTPTPPPA